MSPWTHQRSVILHTFQILYAECGVHHLKLNPECKVNKSMEMWFVLLDGEPVQLSACEYSVPRANQRCFLVTSAIYFLLLRGQSHIKNMSQGQSLLFLEAPSKTKQGLKAVFRKGFSFSELHVSACGPEWSAKGKAVMKKQTHIHEGKQGLIVNTLKQYRTVTSKRKPEERGSLKWQK